MRLVWNMRVFAAAALPVLLSPLAARAEAGGLPQLDTTLYPAELFWLAITFAVLYGLMAFVALPRVTQTKLHRRQVIHAEIEKARLASDAAQLATEKVEKLLREARDAAHASARDMMVSVGETVAARQSAQDKALFHRLQDSEAVIVKAREAALVSVRANAPDMASAITEKLFASEQRGVA